MTVPVAALGCSTSCVGRQRMTHHPLDLVARRRELLGDALVGDDHGAVRRERVPGGGERLDGAGEVVQRLEDQDQVVRPLAPELGGVADLEAHAVGDPCPVGCRAGLLDRSLIEVEAVHAHRRIGLRDRERRPALSAPELGDPGRRLRLQPAMDVGDRGQPGTGELVGERRPVDRALAVPERRAVPGVRHAAAGAVRVEDQWQRLADPREQRSEGRQVREVGAIRQHRSVLGRQPVGALVGGALGAVDLQEAGHRLLLEPLAGVPDVDSGPLGERGRRERLAAREGVVEAQRCRRGSREAPALRPSRRRAAPPARPSARRSSPRSHRPPILACPE
jgi:hypothetical protein